MFAHESVAALLALGAGVGLVSTGIARGFARRAGLVDKPDGQRKGQAAPVPVAGGVAVLVAALVTLAGVALLDPAVAAALTLDPRKTLALLAGAVLITGVGVVDDRFNLRARYKLGGQLLAIAALVAGGDFVVHSVCVFGLVIDLGRLGGPFTVFWLLACVNALNLIDGMDGLLGTVGGIALVTFAVIAAITGHVFAASVALAMAGAVFGFLWWNLPPATIYLGDAGSMLIGLVVGAVAIPASLKGPAVISLCAPLAILVLPAFDTAAAIVRRKLTGRGLAQADCGHLHHRMLDRGLTPKRVLTVVAALGTFAAAGALGSIAWSNDLFALVAAAGVVASLVTCKLFGHSELGLIRARVAKTVRSVFVGDASAWGLAVRLQGSRDWDAVWTELTALARDLGVHALRLDVNAPALRENYHARWDSSAAELALKFLQLEVPLLGPSGSPIGQLAITIPRDGRPLGEAFALVARLIETFEFHAAGLTAPGPRPDPRPTPALAAAPLAGRAAPEPVAIRA